MRFVYLPARGGFDCLLEVPPQRLSVDRRRGHIKDLTGLAAHHVEVRAEVAVIQRLPARPLELADQTRLCQRRQVQVDGREAEVLTTLP